MGRKPSGRPRGRPLKDEAEKAIRVTISLAVDVVEMLDEIAVALGRSHAISELIQKAYRRKR